MAIGTYTNNHTTQEDEMVRFGLEKYCFMCVSRSKIAQSVCDQLVKKLYPRCGGIFLALSAVQGTTVRGSLAHN